MASDTPVVFLAFANSPDDHLDNLKTESRELFRVLQGLEADDRLEVHREESSDIDELYEDLLAYDGRIVIFHYGGHANGASLRLEGGDGGAEGLARLLGQQPSLRLVFLNGCATEGHVKHLMAHGVPAVIATSVPIGDRKALEFSVAFYRALAGGRSVHDAFESGRAFVEGKHGTSGAFATRSGSEWDDDGYDDEDYDTPVLEWCLYANEQDQESLQSWRLPEAQEAWKLSLSDADGPLLGLDGTPLTLNRHARTRTFEALVCNNCGATIGQASADNCPVCGSSEVATATLTAELAEQRLPFDIDEDGARAVLREVAGEATLIDLHAIYVPYWIIGVAIRGEISGERGTVRDFTADDPKPAWESIADTVDLPAEDFLVKATALPVGRDPKGGDWDWTLDNAESFDAVAASDAPNAVLSLALPKAFESATRELHDELDAEAIERVGGQLQRNVSSTARYRSVAARSILLPHWFARIEQGQTETGIVINGQSGAARQLKAPGLAQQPDGINTSMSQRISESTRASTPTSYAASIFAGVGIGLMVGLLLGLSAPSAKSTVGIFIGAVGVALAALLGLNDRHFSTAKGLRIGSFGLAVVLAAPLGIYARDHGLFSPTFAERIEEITALDYSPAQALDFLKASRTAAEDGEGSSGTVAALPMFGVSALFSGETLTEPCDAVVSVESYHETMPFDEVKAFYTATEYPEWKRLAEAADTRFEGDDRRKALLIARDALCQRREFGPAFRPERRACELFAALPADANAANVPMAFAPLMKRVDADISSSVRRDAALFVASTVCPKS